MSVFIRITDIANRRRTEYLRRIKRKRTHHGIRFLYFKLGQVYGLTQYAAGSPGFQPAHRKAFPCKCRSKPNRRLFTQPSFFSFKFADVYLPFQKGSRRQHNRPCRNRSTTSSHHSLHRTVFYHAAFRRLSRNHIDHRILIYMQIFFLFESVLRSLRI